MADKFPEAYERFEKEYNTSNYRTFERLLFAFTMWEKYAPTYKQRQGIREQIRERNIDLIETEIRFSKKNKIRMERYRSTKTGKYLKRSDIKRYL